MTLFFISKTWTQEYVSAPCNSRVGTVPSKAEVLWQLGRSRLGRTSDFKYNIAIVQYYLPFQYQVRKKVDSICKNEFCNSFLTIRPILFFYKGFNTDFGTGAGVKVSNKIFSNLYWSYQLSLGWFEGENTRGIAARGINFLHLLGLNFVAHKKTTLFLNGGHCSNGGIFGAGSNQDFFGVGISYSNFH